MSKATVLIDALKREFKARDITYGVVAKSIGVSEATLKRMFSERNFTLQRLDQILQATGISFHDLSIVPPEEPKMISELTWEQEEEIIGDPKKFLVAASVLNLLTAEQITDIYNITPAEITKYLTRLDKIGFLELLPNNRVKLLVTRTFRWIPNGPIQNNFKQQAYADYLESDFNGDHEIMRLVNVMLSKASVEMLLSRLKQVAREFSALHQEDAKLPLQEKHPISFMLAARPWLPDQFKALVRQEVKERIQRSKKRRAADIKR